MKLTKAHKISMTPSLDSVNQIAMAKEKLTSEYWTQLLFHPKNPLTLIEKMRETKIWILWWFIPHNTSHARKPNWRGGNQPCSRASQNFDNKNIQKHAKNSNWDCLQLKQLTSEPDSKPTTLKTIDNYDIIQESCHELLRDAPDNFSRNPKQPNLFTIDLTPKLITHPQQQIVKQQILPAMNENNPF